jgi:TonB family protein
MIGVSLLLMLTIEKGIAQQAPPPPPPPPQAPKALPDSITTLKVKEVNGKAIVTITLKNGTVRTMPIDEAARKGYPVPPPPPPAPPNAPKAPHSILPDGVATIEVMNEKGKDVVKIVGTDGKTKTMSMEEAKKMGYLNPPAPPMPPAPPTQISIRGIPHNDSGKDPLYVFAGLIITKDQMGQIDPNNIESIEVLKGETAIAAYGSKGENGVIRITPKLQDYSQGNERTTKSNEVVVTGYAKKALPENQKTNVVVRGYPLQGADQPLYVLNGTIISPEVMAAFDPKTIKSVSVLKDESATKAYGEKGKNGVVEITTKLQDYSQKNEKTPKSNEVVVVGYGKKALPENEKTTVVVRGVPLQGEDQPLYVLNGKIISPEVMAAIDPKTIKSVSVLKDESATKAYGEKGKNGVVEITTGKDIIIFTKTEQAPQFPGGKEEWNRYLQKNLRYPDKAIDKGVQGVTNVEFVVDVFGNLSQFTILDNPGEGIGEEALRIIKDGPKWEPAVQNGKKVNAQVVQTVTFRLE